MAVDKLVDSTQLNADLTSVANAIRTKGGTSAALAFPAGFVDAIDAIETGGGASDVDAIIDGSVQSISSGVTTVRERAFQNVTALKTVSLTGKVWIKSYAFYGCTGITSFDAKKAYKIFGNAFEKVACDALVFPNITGELGANSLSNFKGTKVDLGGSGFSIKFSAFSGATNLATIILRSSYVLTLADTNAFNNTPFASGKAGGTIYIHKALYDHLGDGTSLDYKAKTNWSVIDGYGTITWAQIEGSIYETQYADGTPIE